MTVYFAQSTVFLLVKHVGLCHKNAAIRTTN